MFASVFFLAAMQLSIPFGKPRQIEQPRAPIEKAGPRWAATCTENDDWDKAGPPVRIHGNAYYVGTCGISAILITGTGGHILIDGTTEKGAGVVAANIAALGFKLSDVRTILTSHEHFDHVGGIAELQQRSRASLVTSLPASRVFTTGLPAKDDPQAGMHKAFPSASVERVIRDGEQVRLGNLMVEAIATPGHSPGSMSWRWISCDGGVCRTIVYADSLTPVSRDDYRFSDHPEYLQAYRASIAKIAASPCDILLSPHPSASGLRDRFARGERLLDPDGCTAYAAEVGKALDERLAKEAAQAKPRR
ncbi:MAG: subclass B3 metallo-beta-lactamase [Sphingomicrobium sp.]